MPEYKAPLRDIGFVMNEVLESEKLYQTLPGYEEATEDLMNAIVEEGAKFAENDDILLALKMVGIDYAQKYRNLPYIGKVIPQ